MIEYRPCIVKGKKALFHRWADKSQVISPGIAVGSHPGGQVWIVIGIVGAMKFNEIVGVK